MIGTTLGNYRVIGELGAGGMGEVWRATDEKLGREVALKVLPEEFAADPDRMARFEREAKVLASLNHPNIATLFGLESVDSGTDADAGTGRTTFLAMELVEGEDLSERIARGAIPVGEAIPIALQIAEALEAAHEQGIVHRDLKPANIKLTDDGTVKVLDFGLAKVSGLLNSSDDPSEAPTMTQTQAGVILGTAAYMSPEQASGKVADRRADSWAFGVVLWEMLTASRLFAGASAAEVRASVLTQDLDLDFLPGSVPPAVRELLRRCLEREPRRRLQHIGEARLVLEDLRDGRDPFTAATAPARPRSAWLPWAIAGVLGIAALGLGLRGLQTPEDDRSAGEPVQFEVRIPDGGQIVAAEILTRIALSPDGRHLAFVAQVGGKSRLFVRELGSLEAVPLEGVENPFSPFWSPDSRYIGFFSGGSIMRIDIAGGPPREICSASYQGRADWGDDGSIIFAGLGRHHSGLARVDANGGEPQPVTTIDREAGEVMHLWPQYLPESEKVLFLRGAFDRERGEIVRHLVSASIDGREQQVLMPLDSRFEILPSGHILYVRERTLLVQPFDLDRVMPFGEPVPLISGLSYMIQTGFAEFSASHNGAVAVHGGLSTTEMVLLDRRGRRVGEVGRPGPHGSLQLDPSGRLLAVETYDSRLGSRDIWTHDLELGTSRRLTLGSSDDTDPMWWSDRQMVVFASDMAGAPDIYRVSSGEGGEPEAIISAPYPLEPKDVLPLTGEVIYAAYSSATSTDLWRAIPGDPSTIRPYLQTDHGETGARVSRDGRWVAFLSNETGSYEVYVARADDASTRRRVSVDGGWSPLWRGDGRELYFLSGNGALAAAFDPDRGALEGRPILLFEIEGRVWRGVWDVTPDGETFVINRSLTDSRRDPIRVILNWPELTRLFEIGGSP